MIVVIVVLMKNMHQVTLSQFQSPLGPFKKDSNVSQSHSTVSDLLEIPVAISSRGRNDLSDYIVAPQDE